MTTNANYIYSTLNTMHSNIFSPSCSHYESVQYLKSTQYMVVLVLLLLLETALATDIFLNSDWEKVHYVFLNLLFFLAKQTCVACHEL